MNTQNFNCSTDTQVLEREETKTASITKYGLIIYNDDVNTFDHVIETLIDVCGHDSVQAEQCTMLIHYKGKCDVKHGSFKELSPMCEEILRRGISAKIEK
ncbi:MAG: ATP-dependent Clp protease adaptor ClpS [Bacteroidota bacterium]